MKINTCSSLETLLLQEVIQNASVGIVLYDENDHCIFKNKLFDSLFSLPANFQNLGFKFQDFIAHCFARGDYGEEHTLQQVLDFCEIRMKSKSPMRIERRQASGVWLEIKYLPLSLGRYMVTYHDVTSARVNEEKARRFESIIQASEDAIVIKDLTGKIISWNPGAKRIFGYEAEEVIGQNISILFPSDQKIESREILESVSRNERVKTVDAVRIRKDGSSTHVSVSITPVFDKFGKVTSVCSIARDIQDRIKVQNDLELAQQVFLSASEAIMVCDENNKVVSVNPAFSKLTGYEVSEILGETPNLLSSGSHDHDFYAAMWKEIVKTGHWDGEIVNRKKNGELFVEWLRVSSAFKQDGSLHRRIAIFSDITEKKQTEEKIWMSANYDQLTQLPNRNFFQTKLNEQIAIAKQHGSGFALLFLDLDKFKEVNDTYGHIYGDTLLKQVAQRITSCLRVADFVSRLGGDEFTVILPGLVNTDKISEIAQKILNSLRMPFDLDLPDHEETFISCSLGITLFPRDANNHIDLIKHADQAMYLSKRSGRDCYSYYANELNTRALERHQLVNDLRSAISLNQLEIYYQPIVDLQTFQIRKAEALLRWNHPEQGILLPAQFMKLAEETGLIHDIGDWVLRQVTRQSQQINHCQKTIAIQLSVNVSPIQLHAKNNHLQQLANEELANANILLEITESALLNIDDLLTNTMYLFRDRGLEVAIDDFGTGYSSLDYLRKLDIDYLKIDQTFVRELGASNADNSLCEAIISMAHKLNIKVIAEGVERKIQHDLLVGFGCDMAQGYYYCKPLRMQEFLKVSELGVLTVENDKTALKVKRI